MVLLWEGKRCLLLCEGLEDLDLALNSRLAMA